MLRTTRAEIVAAAVLVAACTSTQRIVDETPRGLEKCSSPAVEITNNGRQQLDVVAIVANGETTGRPIALGIVMVGQKERFPLPRFTSTVMLKATATGNWISEGAFLRKYVCDEDKPAK